MSTRKQRAATNRMWLVAAVAVVVVAAMIGIGSLNTRQLQKDAAAHDGPTNARGKETARVTVTEFGDYQ